MRTANLNINALEPDAIDALHRTDHKLVGTKAYMGIAWFWHNEYKHYLRGDIKRINYITRRRVHNALLDAGLKVDGCSDLHHAIVTRYTGIR